MKPADEIHLLVPGDPARRTGGSLYDARIAAGLREQGWNLHVHGLEGEFPGPSETAAHALNLALAAIPDGGLAIVDGLALGGLPDVAERHTARIRITALVHHPLCDETGLPIHIADKLLESETRAVNACHRVITTSRFTARRLQALGIGRQSARVVEPGTDPAPVSTHTDAQGEPQRLLYVASLVPRKAQDLLIRALAPLKDRAWRCTLVGAPRDPGFADSLEQMIDRAGLADRFALPGEANPDALQAHYAEADVFVLPSHYEGFGMVATEAIARGLPLISTTGGALTETVPDAAALKVAPGARSELTDAIQRWLDDAKLRARLRAGALAARAGLTDWPTAVRRFAAALTET